MTRVFLLASLVLGCSDERDERRDSGMDAATPVDAGETIDAGGGDGGAGDVDGGTGLPFGSPCTTTEQCAVGECLIGFCTRACGDDCECPPFYACGARTRVCEGGRESSNTCATCVPDCAGHECGRGGCASAPTSQCGTCSGGMACSVGPCGVDQCTVPCERPPCPCD